MHGFKFLPSPVDEPTGTDLAQIRRVLAIEAEQEYALAKSWREHGDEEAERRLITSTAPRRQDRLELPKLRPALLQAHPRSESRLD